LTDECQYRGYIIRARTRASPDGGWTHDGFVAQDLRYDVDDHLFSAPGKSATREEAVKVILAHGKQIIDNLLA
jgi:hypothetical protein